MDIKEILAGQPSRRNGLSDEVAKARHKEQEKRNSKANYLATKALKRVFAAEYADLRAQAKAIIDQESGPLPGDE